MSAVYQGRGPTQPLTPAPKAAGLPGNFQEILDAIGRSDHIGQWHREAPEARLSMWSVVALQLADLDEGATILKTWASNSHRSDFQVRFAGESYGDHGEVFYSFHFRVEGVVDIVSWIEDDSRRSLTVFRGDGEAFNELNILLMNSDGFYVSAAYASNSEAR